MKITIFWTILSCIGCFIIGLAASLLIDVSEIFRKPSFFSIVCLFCLCVYLVLLSLSIEITEVLRKERK